MTKVLIPIIPEDGAAATSDGQEGTIFQVIDLDTVVAVTRKGLDSGDVQTLVYTADEEVNISVLSVVDTYGVPKRLVEWADQHLKKYVMFSGPESHQMLAYVDKDWISRYELIKPTTQPPI